MHNGCWSSVGAANSFRVWFLAIGGLGKMGGGWVGLDGGVEEEWEWEGWREQEVTSCLKSLWTQGCSSTFDLVRLLPQVHYS